MRATGTRTLRWPLLAAGAACAAWIGGAPAVRSVAAAAAAEVSPGPPSAPAAPAAARTVTVSGVGVAKAKPTVVELSGVVSGEAELAADAIVKYRDTKRRALKAIDGLKLASLAVASKGFAVNQAVDPNVQQMLMRGQTPTAAKQSVAVTEQVLLRLTGVDKLADDELMNTVLKLIDTARDAGLAIGSGSPRSYQQMMYMAQTGQGGSGLAAFKVPDAAALRAQAYERGMGDAKAKAQRLAELAGAKLGRVIAVQEGGAGVDSNPSAAAYRAALASQGIKLETNDNEVASDVFGEIPLTVTLSVQYALE